MIIPELDMSLPPSPGGSQWHLDRRVPVALLVAILVQTSGAFWWAASISERVGQLERDIRIVQLAVPSQSEKVVKVETQVDLILRTLSDVQSDVKSIIRDRMQQGK